ncbi:ATP-dependent Clp protease proteolytic subunit 2-like [Stigmatopora nigra]
MSRPVPPTVHQAAFFLLLLLLAQIAESFDLPSRWSGKKNGWVSPDPLTLSQKAVVTQMTTRRDTIKMPSETPMVPWRPPGASVATFVDLYSAMYRDRTLMISKFIDDEAANEYISIILWMRSQSMSDKISIYFNVPGGLLRPALAIYDLLEQTKDAGVEIETINLGLCTGMGSMLCAGGTKGKRFAMPNSRFLLQRTGMNQPVRGQAADIVLEVKNVKLWNDRMENELSKVSGQPLERIQNDLKRDFYLSSDEAVQYGLIDGVIPPAPLKRAARGQDADFGAFGGDDEQRYQGQEAQSGWGSRQPAQEPEKGGNDDGGPGIMKG